MPLSELLSTSSEDLKSELQLILNTIVEGVCGIDRQGNGTFCNDALLRLTGFSAPEVIGQNMHQLLHHTRRDGSPYPAEECVFLQAVKANRAIHTAGEFIWRKDGTCFPAECWCHPLPGGSGSTAYLVTLMGRPRRRRCAVAKNASSRSAITSTRSSIWRASTLAASPMSVRALKKCLGAVGRCPFKPPGCGCKPSSPNTGSKS